jgi:site-specific recombinase XerD
MKRVLRLKGLLKDYQIYLQQQKREESTIRMYLHEVQQCLEWLEGMQKKLNDITIEDVVRFRDHELAKGMKAATVNKSLSTINSFFKWALSQKLLDKPLYAEQIRLHEEKRDSPRFLDSTQEELLLQMASREKKPFKRTRDQALIYVMLYAGLRVEEVSQLLLKSLSGNVLLVYDGGKVTRQVPLLSHAEGKLSEWIQYRKEANKTLYRESAFLFVTKRAGKMQSRSIQFVVEGYSEKLGFTVTCQLLRNTFCRRLVEQGKSLEEVQKLSGHKSILTSYKFFDIEI